MSFAMLQPGIMGGLVASLLHAEEPTGADKTPGPRRRKLSALVISETTPQNESHANNTSCTCTPKEQVHCCHLCAGSRKAPD